MSKFLDDKKRTTPFDRNRLSAFVSRVIGKSFLAQRREIFHLQRSIGLLSAEEYYYYRLYDSSRFAMPDALKFIGLEAQMRILSQCSMPYWYDIAHDKVLFQIFMQACRFPIPRIVATFHRGRQMPGAIILRTEAEIRTFLRGYREYPLFGKPFDGMFSLGSARFEGYDPTTDELTFSSGVSAGVVEVAQELATFSERGYLFQEVKHPDVRMLRVCGDRIACLRVVTLLNKQTPEIFRALWKIPAGRHIADNFWRQGNMLAAIDIPTGRVTRVVAGFGPNHREVERHPDSGEPLIGFIIPRWQEVQELCLSATSLVAGLGMQGWDIAVCPEGPVIIEVNVGGDFNLPQLATGTGLLDERFSTFLREGGYDPGRKSRRTLAALKAFFRA
ncbi:MAG: hypothetical protein HQM09_22255 [Candidatus Riflebacteria bacterium]|nr:hypothetical protein [Candidatus Riflebacteria bacterium]